MKKYAIITCSIFLFQAGYMLGQVKTNEKTTQPKNDRTNQTQDKTTQERNTQDKNTQSQSGDRTGQLETYDNFDGIKVVYYGAKTGTLDTLAENPAKGNMSNNNLGKDNTGNTSNNNNRTNTDKTIAKNKTDNTTAKDKTNTDNRVGKNDNTQNNNQNNNMNSGVDNTAAAASGKCGKYVRSGQQKYDYLKINLKGKLTDVNTFATYSGTAPKIKMKVYSTAPIGTLIEVQLGKKMNTVYPGGTNSQYQAYTTVTNAWEEVEFKFSQTPRGSETSTTDIDQITLMFNPNSSTSDTYYFDDIMGPALVSDKSVSVD